MVTPARPNLFSLSGCWAAGIEGRKFSFVLRLMNFNQVAFSLTQGTNEPSPPASISNICPGTWNLALPPAVAGSLHLALHSVFSTQAPTGCEGLMASLIFPNTRKLGASDPAMFIWNQVFTRLAVKILWHRKSEYCRVAPVCVNSSIHTWLWWRLFIGVTPPDRRSGMPSKEGGGPLNNL